MILKTCEVRLELFAFQIANFVHLTIESVAFVKNQFKTISLEVPIQHQEPTVGTLIQVAPPELPSQPPVTKTQPTVLKSAQQMPVGLSTVAPLSQSAVLPQNPRFEAKYPPVVKQVSIFSVFIKTKKLFNNRKFKTLENPLEEAKPTASPLLSKHAGPTFIEGPKTPKPKKSNKDKKIK